MDFLVKPDGLSQPKARVHHKTLGVLGGGDTKLIDKETKLTTVEINLN